MRGAYLKAQPLHRLTLHPVLGRVALRQDREGEGSDDQGDGVSEEVSKQQGGVRGLRKGSTVRDTGGAAARAAAVKFKEGSVKGSLGGQGQGTLRGGEKGRGGRVRGKTLRRS